MAQLEFGKNIPSSNPGASLTPEDMSRVTPADWQEIRKLSRGYCRTVDFTRTRKRMDGSATVTSAAGHAPYGTDDISDDVNQDAVLLFAQRLRDILASCRTLPESGAWVYVRRDGTDMIINRTTLHRWAVRDAAARNGYRVEPPPINAENASEQELPRIDHLARAVVASCIAQHSEEIFRQAFGDGTEFPVLTQIIGKGQLAEDLGRAGILARVAQEREGGAYGSRRAVIRTRDAAKAELRELSERLDEAKNAVVYTSTEPANRD